MTAHPAAFVAAFTLLALLAIGAISADVLVFVVPPTRAQVKHDIAMAAGDTNLGKLCQAATINAVAANYGTVTSVKTVSVATKGNDATATVSVKSNVYSGKIACKYHRSTWQQTGLAPTR